MESGVTVSEEDGPPLSIKVSDIAGEACRIVGVTGRSIHQGLCSGG
jgi:hypothetical protein